MYALRTHMVVALACALAGGCSTAPADMRPNLVGDMKAPSSEVTTGSLPASGYQLSDNELKYDCRKLTGMMQIRILQVRGYDSNKQASAAARGLQSFATPIWGGTKEGLDPEAQHRKDLAMLEAYNRRLAGKNCKTFDLNAELAASKDTTPTPR
ncbi:hypothetical protein [Hyphomicrobium sp. NDB2Meth4]|uniref:hypothetical protein n=1 Tax=Hyphomicrobium sp. NDB2Meth4 TaxID=1892846 RepID=UPI000A6D6D20|nr:hypothetical protein [Hyphomicrobium sp. NDB2Meth4]